MFVTVVSIYLAAEFREIEIASTESGRSVGARNAETACRRVQHGELRT